MFKYDYSVSERWDGDVDGKKTNVETRCTACHKWHKGNYGFEYSCRTRARYRWMIVKLCPQCAKKHSEMLNRIGMELYSITKGEEA